MELSGIIGHRILGYKDRVPIGDPEIERFLDYWVVVRERTSMRVDTLINSVYPLPTLPQEFDDKLISFPNM